MCGVVVLGHELIHDMGMYNSNCTRHVNVLVLCHFVGVVHPPSNAHVQHNVPFYVRKLLKRDKRSHCVWWNQTPWHMIGLDFPSNCITWHVPIAHYIFLLVRSLFLYYDFSSKGWVEYLVKIWISLDKFLTFFYIKLRKYFHHFHFTCFAQSIYWLAT